MASATVKTPPSSRSALRKAEPRTLGSVLDAGLKRVVRTWESFDYPVLGRRIPGTLAIALIAMAIALIVSILVIDTGAHMWYRDGQSHLTISRRLFDNKYPGFQQLGTVWLPAPHLMLLPFVISLEMWSSGWAGAILGILCLGGTAAAVYRITARIGFGRAGRLITLAVLLLNPSFMFSHTVALTEPVLIMTMTASMAGLAHWATAARPLSGGEIAIYVGIPAAVAVLSRYEGWVLVMSTMLFMTVVGLQNRDRFPRLLTRALIPALIVPALAVGWWLFYNYAIYGDPFEFMFGQYSAYNQQEIFSDIGVVTTKGNLAITLWTYNWSVWEIIGWATLIMAGLGAMLLFFKHALGTTTLIIGMMASPYVFSVVSMYLGQSMIYNGHSLPAGLFNVRYAMSSIVFFAVLVGFLVHTISSSPRLPSFIKKTAALGAFTLLSVQLLIWSQDFVARVPVIAEGWSNLQMSLGATAAVDYLREHYDGGNILMDESAAGNAFIPELGVPIIEYYNRSTGDLFDRALEAPASHAKWLLMNTQASGGLNQVGLDSVYDSLLTYPERFTGYTRVFQSETHAVFKRVW